MAARKEIEEDNNSRSGIFCYGMDDISNHGYREISTKIVGSVQYSRNIKGMEYSRDDELYGTNGTNSQRPRRRSSRDIVNSLCFITLTRQIETHL